MNELYFYNEKQKIENLIEYIQNVIKNDKGDENSRKSSSYRIAIGCDSCDRKRRTKYAITIVFYNENKKDGAHVIHKSIVNPKALIRKCQYLSQWKKEKVDIDSDFIKISDNQYIFNRLYIENQYLLELGLYLDEKLKGKYYRNYDVNEYDGSKPVRLVEIHLDYNSKDISNNHENKSNQLYKLGMGLFAGYGFKVYSKPDSWAAFSAANIYCRK